MDSNEGVTQPSCSRNSSCSISSSKRRMAVTGKSGLKLVKEAIGELKEPSGATLKQITDFIENKYSEQLRMDKKALYTILRAVATKGSQDEEIAVSKDGRRFKLGPLTKKLLDRVLDAERRRKRRGRRRGRRGKTAKKGRKRGRKGKKKGRGRKRGKGKKGKKGRRGRKKKRGRRAGKGCC